MPWIANTRAQWEADLAKPKRLQMTFDRAEAFFARRDVGRPSRPSEPVAQAAFHELSSDGQSSSSSSSTSSSQSKDVGRRQEEDVPGNSVPWACKGGQARIHGFCGKVGDRSATSVCPLKVQITGEFSTGLASTKGEAEMSTQSKWCKHCERMLW